MPVPKKLEPSELYTLAAIIEESGLDVDVENNNKTHKTNILRVHVPKRKAPAVVLIRNGKVLSSGIVPGFQYKLDDAHRWFQLFI